MQFFKRQSQGGRSSRVSRRYRALNRRRSGPFAFESLEGRLVLTTMIHLDFGFNFPAGGLLVTNALSASVNGLNVFDASGNTLISLETTVQNQNIDLNSDLTADLTDAMILANGVLEAVQRTYEPYDIIVTQAAASNFTDIANTLAANGNGLGNRDAYIIVAGDDPTSNPAFGWAPVNTGNSNDNTAFAFADEMIRSLGAAILGLGRTAAHEAAHTFGLNHTNGSVLTGIGDLMGVPISGQPDLRDFFDQHITTRFKLGLQAGGGTQNNYDVLADPNVVGLIAGGPAYVTGTGAHDRITITRVDATQANIVVDVFDSAAMTNMIDTDSYTINTTNGILVEGGANNDLIIVDPNIGKNVEVRGGDERDTLRVLNGTPIYTPDASADPSEGTLLVGGVTITFSEMEFVEPVAPVLTDLFLSATNIDEGDTITLSGDVIDPGSLSSHTITIDWGDGSSDTILPLPVGNRSFQVTHRYRDDNPTNTPVDANTIQITIIDDNQLSDNETMTITVNNLDPEILDVASDATFEDKAEEGEPVNILAHFTDVGTLDTHTAEVDWGDGSPLEFVSVNQANGEVTGSHPYATGGVFTISLTLTDDDTGTDQATTTAVVTGVGINDRTLYIVGTNEEDEVSVNQQGKDTLKVHIDFLPGEDFRTFNIADIDEIIAYLCEGDDLMTVSNQVALPAIIHAGGGADHVNAGGGPTVLLGNLGDDELVGGFGRNIFVGGGGLDKLTGGKDGDALVGGTTNADQDDLVLLDALNAWNHPTDTYEDRVTALGLLLTAADDGDEDKLTGSSGRDLFFAGLGDLLTGAKADELVI